MPSPFHGRKAVAPLKPKWLTEQFAGNPDLPRPQGRGPIEACTRRGGGRRPATFHGRKAVAPLKHLDLLRVREADRAFHGRKAVAPLKPGDDNAYGAGSASFHGRKAVAPLKPQAQVQQGALHVPSTAARPWPH